MNSIKTAVYSLPTVLSTEVPTLIDSSVGTRDENLLFISKSYSIRPVRSAADPTPSTTKNVGAGVGGRALSLSYFQSLFWQRLTPILVVDRGGPDHPGRACGKPPLSLIPLTDILVGGFE